MSLTLTAATAVFFLTATFEIGFIDASRENYKYIKAQRAWYKLQRTNAAQTWAVARDTCQAEDAVLFHPESEDELREVRAGLSVPDWCWIHSGFTDLKKAGHYETVDGRPIEQIFHKWYRGYPDDGSNKGYRCGALYVGGLELYVSDCDDDRAFICKATWPDPMTALEEAQTTIARLTAKIADQERQTAVCEQLTANQTSRIAVLEEVEREAQATKIQDENRIAVFEQLTANQTSRIAVLEEVEREAHATKIQDENRIAALELLIANQTEASKDKRREEQIVEALERISKVDEKQAIILERLIQTTQQQAVCLTMAMDWQDLAVEPRK